MNKLNEFVSKSQTFNGFEFKGLYTCNKSFIDMFDLFEKTGINLLDAHSMYVYLTWKNNKEIIDYKECDMISESLSLLRKHKIVDSELLAIARNKLSKLRQNYIDYLNRISTEPRRIACIITNKKEIRDEVFKIHGEKCLCCGSTNKISIDHIIPVYLGGENIISNFQPLCKSCNSKKGTKIIDYRL